MDDNQAENLHYIEATKNNNKANNKATVAYRPTRYTATTASEYQLVS